MKLLISIVFSLFLMAQASEAFLGKRFCMNYAEEMMDAKEKEVKKEKQVIKDYCCLTGTHISTIANLPDFTLYTIAIYNHPVIEHLVPPPNA